MHIQGEFRQGIEPFDFSRQEIVYGMANTGSCAHKFSLGLSTTDRVSLKIACRKGARQCTRLTAEYAKEDGS